jgi:hypothetical protein
MAYGEQWNSFAGYRSGRHQVLVDDSPSGPLGGDDMLTATPSGHGPVFDSVKRDAAACRGDEGAIVKLPMLFDYGSHGSPYSRTVPTVAPYFEVRIMYIMSNVESATGGLDDPPLSVSV